MCLVEDSKEVRQVGRNGLTAERHSTPVPCGVTHATLDCRGLREASSYPTKRCEAKQSQNSGPRNRYLSDIGTVIEANMADVALAEARKPGEAVEHV